VDGIEEVRCEPKITARRYKKQVSQASFYWEYMRLERFHGDGFTGTGHLKDGFTGTGFTGTGHLKETRFHGDGSSKRKVSPRVFR